MDTSRETWVWRYTSVRTETHTCEVDVTEDPQLPRATPPQGAPPEQQQVMEASPDALQARLGSLRKVSGELPIPGRQVVIEEPEHRRMKVKLREDSEAYRWEGKPLRPSNT